MHCNKTCGLTFNASYILSGSYEGSIFFYESNKYPYGAIGEVRYFWQPTKSATQKTLWLWCHPSFYNDVLNELIKSFYLEIEESMVVDEGQSESIVETTSVEKTKLELRNVPFAKTPKYYSRKNSIKMVLLKDTLNRFRLTGPLAPTLLTQAFRPIDLKQRRIQDWAHKYYQNEKHTSNAQNEFWQKLKNVSVASQLPRHMIFSLIVIDPRFTLPSGRKKPEIQVKGIFNLFILCFNIMYKSLNRRGVRDRWLF